MGQERGLPAQLATRPARRACWTAYGALELGIPWLSAYAFSTENWRRSPTRRLSHGFNRDVIRRRRDEMNAMGFGSGGRAAAAGRGAASSELEVAEQMTATNTKLTLTMCVVNYGRSRSLMPHGRWPAMCAPGRADPSR